MGTGLEHTILGAIGLACGVSAGLYGGYIIGEHLNQEYFSAAHHIVKGLIDIVPMAIGAVTYGPIGGYLGVLVADVPRRW